MIVKVHSLEYLSPVIQSLFPIVCIQAPYRAWRILTMNKRHSTIEIILFVKDQHGKAVISEMPYGIIADAGY